MIPLQLTLKNFLSYRETSIDFRGLHTACICGANGAGKSSLLEAITWAIWGESRAASEEDVINAGANDVRVDFEFISNCQTYRIIRNRSRGKSAALEFQILTESGKFRSLSGKGIKVTQQLIVDYLKLDYETFINSAYLRQGKADEFMLRRASERKQILADLLKLDRYERLAEKSKELAKKFKIQLDELELSQQPIVREVEKKNIFWQDKQVTEQEIIKLEKLQTGDGEKLKNLQTIEHQREAREKQLHWQQDRQVNIEKDCVRLSEDLQRQQKQIDVLEKLLDRETTIEREYQNFLDLQKQEETLAIKFQADLDMRRQKQELQEQLIHQRNNLNLQIQENQTRLETLQKQEQQLQEILQGSDEVKIATVKLEESRKKLADLDRLQKQVNPLIQQRQNIQVEIEKTAARLRAKQEQLLEAKKQIDRQLEQVPEIRKKALTVNTSISQLDKKKVYQQRVHDKGLDKRSLQERLQENQRTCSKQLEELKQKLKMLEIPEATCPLCEQELDKNYLHRVVTKTQHQHQELEGQIWTIQEQIRICERELQGLREEYQQIKEELQPYDLLQQQLGQLEAQLEATTSLNHQLQEIDREIETLDRSLVIGNYDRELQKELAELDLELSRLNYDEKTHALIRGEVESFRWAEIKQAKIEDAKKNLVTIAEQISQTEHNLFQLQRALQELNQSSEIQKQIEELEAYLQELNYDRSQHQNINNELRQGQQWQLKYQELQQTKQQYPESKNRLQEIEQLLAIRLKEKEDLAREIKSFLASTEQIIDCRQEIKFLEQQMQQRRQELDELFAKQGSIQQNLKQIEDLEKRHQENTQKLKEYRRQQTIYQELAQAFGKNGIQALTIENVLPQLEAHTNQILARLTGNQLHVRFLTQKSTRSGKKETQKLMDTLDILISDARGTRSYETYSGGEAFRINFSIRLALAKLLAQRAGTALQMLIVDEGFGTQDSEGCDRLIAAINTIAGDFACILTVTHMPQFKEAFQTRIEVRKTSEGSQVSLLN